MAVVFTLTPRGVLIKSSTEEGSFEFVDGKWVKPWVSKVELGDTDPREEGVFKFLSEEEAIEAFERFHKSKKQVKK